MGLFKNKAVTEAKELIYSVLLNCDMTSIKGVRWEIDNDKDSVFFRCDEDNFSQGLKRYLGYGDYYGSIMFLYNTKERYLVADIYYGEPIRTYAELNTNAEFAKTVFDFDITVTNCEHAPNVHISKIISPNSLQAELEKLILMVGTMIE